MPSGAGGNRRVNVPGTSAAYIFEMIFSLRQKVGVLTYESPPFFHNFLFGTLFVVRMSLHIVYIHLKVSNVQKPRYSSAVTT